VIFPAFKAGDSVLSGPNGGFDSHTLPPIYLSSATCASILVPIGTFVPIGAVLSVFMRVFWTLPCSCKMLSVPIRVKSNLRRGDPGRTLFSIENGQQLAGSLDVFQSSFSFLFGTELSSPHHTIAAGAGHMLIEDEFNRLAAPKLEVPAQPESSYRGIQDEAGHHLRAVIEIDDKTGASLRHHPLRVPGHQEIGHSFTPYLR
jgi:hypothetical protein